MTSNFIGARRIDAVVIAPYEIIEKDGTVRDQ